MATGTPVYYSAADMSHPMPLVTGEQADTAEPMPRELVAQRHLNIPAGFVPMLVGGAPAAPLAAGPVYGAATAGAPAPGCELTDRTVTLAPYFRLKDAAKFKDIWRQDYNKFAHKEDCVHYAFCFTHDGERAHCREAYTCAETVLQHLADVDQPLKAVLDGSADLERLEVHGPQEEVDKLREALAPLGCLFYVTEWGCRPDSSAMPDDTVCHLYPYFKLKQPESFRKIWHDAYPAAKRNMEAEKSYQYAFSFEPTQGLASCRGSYADAASIFLHLKNVDSLLNAALNGPADLLRLEVHGPAAEIQKLKPSLSLVTHNAHFFVTEWGFRNQVPMEGPSATGKLGVEVEMKAKKSKKSKKAKVSKKKKGCC